MNQREIKQSIKDNPNLTATEKIQKLNEVRAPYKEMTDEELLQLVRDFTEENGREPMQADVLYDRELKQRFGPWNRMLERAGTRPVAQSYLDKKRRRKEKRQRHKEYRRQIREQAAAQGVTAAADDAKETCSLHTKECLHRLSQGSARQLCRTIPKRNTNERKYEKE